MADLKAFAEQLVNLTVKEVNELATILKDCLLYTSPSPRDYAASRMPSSA